MIFSRKPPRVKGQLNRTRCGGEPAVVKGQTPSEMKTRLWSSEFSQSIGAGADPKSCHDASVRRLRSGPITVVPYDLTEVGVSFQVHLFRWLCFYMTVALGM